MGLFDNVKKQMGNAVGNAKKAAESLQDSVKDLDTEKAFTNFRKSGTDTLQKMKTGGANLYGKALDSFQKKESTRFIREKDALTIMYYLIASDMSVDEKEIDMFDSIGQETDPHFSSYRDEIIDSCNATVAGVTDRDEFFDILHEQVNHIIQESQNSADGNVLPTLLIWNLISIAFAEGRYSASEKRLIRSVARALSVDATVVKEMESTIQTMLALKKEEMILKSSDRRYSEVEPYLNELADREQTIMTNVKALMLD